MQEASRRVYVDGALLLDPKRKRPIRMPDEPLDAIAWSAYYMPSVNAKRQRPKRIPDEKTSMRALEKLREIGGWLSTNDIADAVGVSHALGRRLVRFLRERSLVQSMPVKDGRQKKMLYTATKIESI